MREALVFARHLEDLARLRRVRDRMDREYAQPLDVEALARDARMPAALLSRRFRQAYGRTPYAYLTARRIERAVALLCRSRLGVPEVRALVGRPSPAAFGACFTAVVGVPPGVYRQRALAGPPPYAPGRMPIPRPVRIREARLPEPRLA